MSDQQVTLTYPFSSLVQKGTPCRGNDEFENNLVTVERVAYSKGLSPEAISVMLEFAMSLRMGKYRLTPFANFKSIVFVQLFITVTVSKGFTGYVFLKPSKPSLKKGKAKRSQGEIKENTLRRITEWGIAPSSDGQDCMGGTMGIYSTITCKHLNYNENNIVHGNELSDHFSTNVLNMINNTWYTMYGQLTY